MSALIETEIRPAIIVWTLGGETIHTSYGTNCTAIMGADGVVLVDPLIAPAYARLVEAALRHKAKWGTVIVMDVTTGEIETLVQVQEEGVTIWNPQWWR